MADDYQQLQNEIDAALLESAPFAWRIAPSTCFRDPETGASCVYYHRIWQYLLLLGATSSMRTDTKFLVDNSRQAFHTDRNARVLVCGAADYGLLAHILWSAKLESAAPSVVVVDRCKTSLELNQWYANRASHAITVVESDILDADNIGEFDIASALDPNGIGVLFKMRRYDEMIDEAELRMIDFPGDIQLRVYLAFAYNATGQFDAAVRMIETSGVLDAYSEMRRGTEDTDAFNVILNAAYGSGEIDRARELTQWALDTHFEWTSSYWWASLGYACMRAILGEDDEVDRRLQRTLESNVLAWQPMLKDQHCFKRFADDPAYLAVVKHFDDRRALLRARLPATLASYGLAL